MLLTVLPTSLGPILLTFLVCATFCQFVKSRTTLFFQTVRHGFPYQPTAMAFDPVQNLLAIGTKSGSLRMYPFVPPYLTVSWCCHQSGLDTPLL